MCIYPYHPARAKMADFDIVVFACTAIHQTVFIYGRVGRELFIGVLYYLLCVEIM